jgi:tripartite-type tricarboxylate transporter receptor subunit TctC
MARLLLRAAVVVGLVAATAVRLYAADVYPTRPIRLVVGFGAGGPTDIPARYVAEKLGDLLGQRVLVENKPAASGMMATRDVLGQPKDGYNLLLCSHYESINTAVYRNVGFRLDDIAPISLIAKYFYGLALANTLPAADLSAFVSYAKTHPLEISYATIGAAGAQEIFAHQLERLFGIQMNKVPYRTGVQVIQDIIPGRVQFYVSPVIGVLPLAQKDQLKLLAVSAPHRLTAAPDVPTLQESGIDFVRFGWLGICAATGTPQPILDTLNGHLRAIVATPDYRAMTERLGSEAVSSTPAELADIIRRTRAEVDATIQEFGLQQD